MLCEGFIDDVPGKEPPTIVRDAFPDVLLQHGGQLLRREMAFQKPGRIRPSPDQGVAADSHAMGLCERDDLVALREVEGCGVGADDPPLQRVLGFQHVEFVAERERVCGFGELRGAHCSADEDSGAIGQLADGIGPRLERAG
jgi:hypothetical protein